MQAHSHARAQPYLVLGLLVPHEVHGLLRVAHEYAAALHLQRHDVVRQPATAAAATAAAGRADIGERRGRGGRSRENGRVGQRPDLDTVNVGGCMVLCTSSAQ